MSRLIEKASLAVEVSPIERHVGNPKRGPRGIQGAGTPRQLKTQKAKARHRGR